MKEKIHIFFDDFLYNFLDKEIVVRKLQKVFKNYKIMRKKAPIILYNIHEEKIKYLDEKLIANALIAHFKPPIEEKVKGYIIIITSKTLTGENANRKYLKRIESVEAFCNSPLIITTTNIESCLNGSNHSDEIIANFIIAMIIKYVFQAKTRIDDIFKHQNDKKQRCCFNENRKNKTIFRLQYQAINLCNNCKHSINDYLEDSNNQTSKDIVEQLENQLYRVRFPNIWAIIMEFANRHFLINLLGIVILSGLFTNLLSSAILKSTYINWICVKLVGIIFGLFFAYLLRKPLKLRKDFKESLKTVSDQELIIGLNHVIYIVYLYKHGDTPNKDQKIVNNIIELVANRTNVYKTTILKQCRIITGYPDVKKFKTELINDYRNVLKDIFNRYKDKTKLEKTLSTYDFSIEDCT